jgi:DNA-directed RNA polymerase subunit M/transcription elongation factor TFIIS
MSFDEDDGGLGLSDFLTFDPDKERSGGAKGWLENWKSRGQIDVWLHLDAKIRAPHTHQIPYEIEVDEKSQGGEKTGRKIPKLTWPRFVSPDARNIHANQYFREGPYLREQINRLKNGKPVGSMAESYMRDPFLILREYLHHAVEMKVIDPEQPIFEWTDRKNRNELIVWTAGELSRHTKRGFKNRGHSLDTKLDFIFVVVDNDKPGDGPKIARETKLLGEKMRSEIVKQIESRGDDGDPQKNPYGFRWKYNKDETAQKSYDAYRIDKNVCTDEIWQAIGGSPDPAKGESWDIVEAPDTSEFARVNDGDMDKIRKIFESASVIDLPLDAIFSDNFEVRKSVVTGGIFATSKPVASQPRTAQPRPEVTAAPGAARRPGAPASAPATAPATQERRNVATVPATAPMAQAPAAQASATTGPQPRRKKVEAAAPVATPPPVETVPCDDCGAPMLPSDTKCAKCGAEYDVHDELPPAAVVTPAAQASSTARRPNKTSEEVAAVNELAARKCIGCGTTGRIELQASEENPEEMLMICANCGCDQGDDIPF